MKKTIKNKDQETNSNTTTIPSINSVEWTDYVLNLLSDDEKIGGNPTTDGLRRIFEIALNCTLIESTSDVVQTPDVNNEKRATVVHSLMFILNDQDEDSSIKYRTVSGSADVYWGNCDKIYRNHPVAVAETRAEGRALKRALRLRKVVAAEEIAESVDDDPDGTNVSNISLNQINFMDVMSKRTNIDTLKLMESLNIEHKEIRKISHDDAVVLIKKLTQYQQNIDDIPDDLTGYQPQWKDGI